MMKVVARCNKCGREFVTMPTKGNHDRFFPANEKPPKGPTDRICNGLIVPIADNVLVAGITDENRHGEITGHAAVGEEFA